ncbi:hypothetical protein NDU88_002152 [Pleurodeles waltl]|uniref:Uncharacterized protein n=1 Tax=Pleurodeles waltl TaxID=8319 RepID=A0AAV7U8H0_PLEWA|nr:hypothetical protein NDU88_002152 [Pleurodeles waltl]
MDKGARAQGVAAHPMTLVRHLQGCWEIKPFSGREGMLGCKSIGLFFKCINVGAIAFDTQELAEWLLFSQRFWVVAVKSN